MGEGARGAPRSRCPGGLKLAAAIVVTGAVAAASPAVAAAQVGTMALRERV